MSNRVQTNFTADGGSEDSSSRVARAAAADEVPHGTVREVLDWVGTDKARAKKAIAVEKRNDSRVSVIEAAQKILSADED
jgi:hypothetical protein